MKIKSLKKIGVISLFILTLSFAVNAIGKIPDYKIEVKNAEAQNGLIIKADIKTSEIGAKMGELLSALFKYVETNNIQLTGPPFAVYYSYEPEGNTVFELGLPVQGKMDGSGDIEYKEYAAMKVVSTLYVGAYEDMAGIYGSLEQYLKENKLESTGIVWEVYLTNPNEVSSPEENQTIIYFPIK